MFSTSTITTSLVCAVLRVSVAQSQWEWTLPLKSGKPTPSSSGARNVRKICVLLVVKPLAPVIIMLYCPIEVPELDEISRTVVALLPAATSRTSSCSVVVGLLVALGGFREVTEVVKLTSPEKP